MKIDEKAYENVESYFDFSETPSQPGSRYWAKKLIASYEASKGSSCARPQIDKIEVNQQPVEQSHIRVLADLVTQHLKSAFPNLLLNCPLKLAQEIISDERFLKREAVTLEELTEFMVDMHHRQRHKELDAMLQTTERQQG